ncbi:AgmX/PglI C-terminal domain-containing protein [Nannocystis sp.]|uniref:AgmX/PglI C-terminal domain-containing protein n=1 Tax=Nannocystis sp. TaxID=1962667 RepID=UPI00242465E4|nr:AgmX/PglI C-terminal domain-containing protein [Nannocystis sp.]MBK7823922.1 AgmX/PglI C-terminal domain-containing protein [Nannocystis sp.]MBK9754933.1 AgmX/PglI C-terminal domain-containing protein [Nannocystis sp.]
MRNSTLFSLMFVAASAVVPGCTCIARDAETYRADTRSLLETRTRAIKDCYDVALTTDPKLDGQVVVTFKVEKKTGKIIDTGIDSARTKAPESLSKCIVEAVDGLTLDPVDQREGQATFSWTFKANEPKPAEEAAS